MSYYLIPTKKTFIKEILIFGEATYRAMLTKFETNLPNCFSSFFEKKKNTSNCVYLNWLFNPKSKIRGGGSLDEALF